MKYKVGDGVRIKTVEEIRESGGAMEYHDLPRDWTPQMLKTQNMVGTISEFFEIDGEDNPICLYVKFHCPGNPDLHDYQWYYYLEQFEPAYRNFLEKDLFTLE